MSTTIFSSRILDGWGMTGIKTSFLFTCVSTLLAVACLRLVIKWLRICWILRNAPRPPQRWPFSLLLEIPLAFARMDPQLHITAKIYNYTKEMFPKIIDQDVTVAFYGPQPFLVGVTPMAMEAILKSTSNLNKSFIYQMMRPWVGNGILISDKGVWKPRRKMMTPAFHFRTLEDYIPIMNRRAEEMVHDIAATIELEKTFFDVRPIVRRAAFAILFETSMGVEIDKEEVERMRLLEITEELSASIVARAANILHWPDFIYNLTKENREFLANIKRVQTYNNQIVKQRKADYETGIGDEKLKKSFLDILLRLHIEEGILTEQEVRDEVSSIFIGGFDTTATAASFCLYLLGHHPEVQKKVHEEMDEVFGDDWERPVTLDDIKRLKYTECVLKESMRIYPAVPLLARMIDEDIKIGEQTIPKGTVALALIFYVHRHPKYFENPDVFMPERFLETKNRHPFQFVPFSAGPRNCVGQKFAQFEEIILLTQVMRRYKVESKVPMEKLQLAFEIVLTAPEGLELKFTPRERPA